MMLETRIDGISSKTSKADAALIHTFMDELNSALKGRNVKPTHYRIQMLKDERAVIVRGQIDIYTIHSVLKRLKKRKTNWNWNEPRYISTKEEQIEKVPEELHRLYEELRQAKDREKALREVVNTQKVTVGKYQTEAREAKDGVKTLEELLSTKTAQVEFYQAETQQLKIKVEEQQSELKRLRQAFLDFGKIPESAIDYHIPAIKSNIDNIRSSLENSVHFFISNKVFDRLEELMKIEGYSMEEYLRTSLADSNIKIPEDISVKEFLETARVSWEKSETYKKGIREYSQAKEENEFLSNYESNSLSEAIKEIPQSILDNMVSSIDREKNERIIREFETAEEEHKRTYEAFDSIEESARTYELYEKVKKNARVAAEKDVVVKYLIGFEEQTGGARIRVIAPGDNSDKYIGKLIRTPLEELSNKYGIDIQYNSGISEVMINLEDSPDREEASKRLLDVEKIIHGAKKPLKFFGLKAKVTTVCEYNI